MIGVCLGIVIERRVLKNCQFRAILPYQFVLNNERGINHNRNWIDLVERFHKIFEKAKADSKST